MDEKEDTTIYKVVLNHEEQSMISRFRFLTSLTPASRTSDLSLGSTKGRSLCRSV